MLRTPLGDRTQHDAHVFNLPASAPISNKVTSSKPYTHNPYQALVMTEVSEETHTYKNGRRIVSLDASVVPTTVTTTATKPLTPIVLSPPAALSPVPPHSMNDISVQDLSLDDIAEEQHREGEEEDHIDEFLVTVKFHAHSAQYKCSMDIEMGDYVAVDGDRGFDIGIICSLDTRPAPIPNTATKELYWVLRLATTQEIRQCQTEQVNLEEVALAAIRRHVSDLKLNMVVHACDYQYDRKKLNFYYESDSKVLFQNLLKALYKEFKCRIWLQQLNWSHRSNGMF